MGLGLQGPPRLPRESSLEPPLSLGKASTLSGTGCQEAVTPPHTHTPPILASKGMKGQRAEGKMLCFGGGVTKCPATGPLPPLHSKRAAWFPRSQAFLLVEGEVNISSCETVSNRQTAPSVTNGLCFKKYLGLERQLSS